MSNIPIRVLFDISVLGMGHYMPAARTGVFRVVENLARGLAQREDVSLLSCAGAHLLTGDTNILEMCKTYLRETANLCGVPFYAADLPVVGLYHSPYHPLPSQIKGVPRFLMVHDLIAVQVSTLFYPDPSGGCA